jgi:hypothetical protein
MHRSRSEAQAEHVGLESRTRTDRAADAETEDGMSDTPWTPGPWEVARFTDGPADVPGSPGVIRAGEDADKSESYVLFLGDLYQGGECSSADLRLIAAAPDMADFLRLHVAAVDVLGQSNEVVPDWLFSSRARAEALLARIWGEA